MLLRKVWLGPTKINILHKKGRAEELLSKKKVCGVNKSAVLKLRKDLVWPSAGLYLCSMDTLNLPAYPARVALQGSRRVIFDVLRGRFVALTPEEWVRQHFVHYLIDHLGYPAALMGNEVTIRLSGCERRPDTVVYHRQGGRPRIIIEYKAPTVAITPKVFAQISAYNSVLRADYLFISNGLQHYCCHIDYAEQTSRMLPKIPAYAELG